MPEPRIEYVAGLMDGEGYLGLVRKGKSVSAVMMIEMIDREPMDVVAAVLGGQVETLNRVTKTNKTVYRWSARGLSALAPLLQLDGRLVGKRDQAKVLIEYLVWRGEGHRGVKPTIEEIAESEKYRVLMQELKHPNQRLSNA